MTDKKTKNFRKKISLILKTTGIAFLLSIIFSFSVFIFYAKDLPLPENFTEKTLTESTKIYDRTGEVLLYEISGREKRTNVPLEEISENLKLAVIAIEDNNFYIHQGIDFKGILRSILINIRKGTLSVGGSTIPQQLIRTTFFSPEKTIKRKIRELILAIELDRKYEKDQILEWYLNQIPLGSNIYGVEEASQRFFNKSSKNLSIEEAAVIASIIQAPTFYSPYGNNIEYLMNRKNLVLKRMNQLGFISDEEYTETKEKEIIFSKITQSIKAPHFVLYVKDYLVSKYGEDFINKKGLKVYTTLDYDLQEWSEESIKEGSEFNKMYNANNAALISIDPNTGEILSMVGSKDYFGDAFPLGCTSGKDCSFDPQYNIITKFPGRQPGSAFKPFVYVTAFEKGFDDKTTVIDEETNFGIYGGKEYIPQNYDGLYRGEVSLRSALAQSLNIPSVKVLDEMAGLEDSIKTAQNMGITTLNRDPSFYGLSLVLGGGDVRPIDIVSAYGVFATQGLRIPTISVLKIEDTNGNIIEQNKKSPKRVLSIDSSKIITDILSDNKARAPMFGFNSALHFEEEKVAVKTGTTSNYRDAWTIGYTPSIVAGVWVGNNNNTEMSPKPAVTLAGKIWHDFMEKAILKLSTN